MFASVRKRLPGPKATAFWGSVAGAVGFYRYNKRESQQRLDYYCKRAEQVAGEPVGTTEVVRKVHVYIAVPMGELGTRKARQHWEQYVLPVFAAGALDYELTLVNETEKNADGGETVVRGGVHRAIAEEIKERRRGQLEAGNAELELWRAAVAERQQENERRQLKNRLGVEPGMSVLELWKAQPYPAVMDIVAIGRETWIEAVNGVSDGAVGSLDMAMPPLVALDADAAKPAGPIAVETRADGAQVMDTAGQPAPASDDAAPAAAPVQTIGYDRYDVGERAGVALPALAYIAHERPSGWGGVAQRVWSFFHDQQNVDRYASQALQVVFEATRRAAQGVQELEAMGRSEEEQPAWEGQPPLDVVVDSDVAARLQIYDTQRDGAPLQ
ncbi:hypothetical protein H4R19_003764 [Coemansia spiralis]|nr:hypothetical protein H4R19_003764 [Coemansia spiralis]